MDRLLTVEQAGVALGTGPRFVRRLIAERRIRFHKLGRHVRIAEDDLATFIASGTVEPHREQRGAYIVAIHRCAATPGRACWRPLRSARRPAEEDPRWPA
jgi:excisionase family DNA binding protein